MRTCSLCGAKMQSGYKVVKGHTKTFYLCPDCREKEPAYIISYEEIIAASQKPETVPDRLEAEIVSSEPETVESPKIKLGKHVLRRADGSRYRRRAGYKAGASA